MGSTAAPSAPAAAFLAQWSHVPPQQNFVTLLPAVQQQQHAPAAPQPLVSYSVTPESTPCINHPATRVGNGLCFEVFKPGQPRHSPLVTRAGSGKDKTTFHCKSCLAWFTAFKQPGLSIEDRQHKFRDEPVPTGRV